MGCPSRLRGHGCSIDPTADHEIHVALSTSGRIVARWRMVPQELADDEPPAFPPDLKETP